MTLNPIRDQRDFLVACEQNSPAFAGLYTKLVHEEWSNETRVALEAGNQVALFDGLLDTVYVLAGLANTLRDANTDDSFEIRQLPEGAPQAWASAIQEVSVACQQGNWNPHQAIRAAEIVWSLGVKLGFPMDTGWLEVHVSVALLCFSEFVATYEPAECEGLPVWGNGASFDNVILRGAYERIEMQTPWHFWQDRCYRTVKALNKDVPFERAGVHHRAVDDAESQALHLMKILSVEASQCPIS